MATTSTTPAPAPTAATTIGQDIQKLLPIFEILANVGLVAATSGGALPASSLALASAIEGGINPLIQAIQQKSATTTDVFIALSGLIATLNVMKAEVKDPATLTRINTYLAAAQAGLTGWVTGGKGFDPANYQPVAPIA